MYGICLPQNFINIIKSIYNLIRKHFFIIMYECIHINGSSRKSPKTATNYMFHMINTVDSRQSTRGCDESTDYILGYITQI